jgi:ankyrin repeat protein
MSDKQIEEKKRRNLANKEIVKKGISIDKIRKLLLEEGADVNTGRGQALDNAIAEGDVQKVKFLLDYGAAPNLRGKQEASINKLSEITKEKEVDPETSKKAFEILKYMLRAGAELTPVVFRALIADEDAVKFCLENGMDPNMERGLALRVAIRRGLMGILKLLIEAGASLPEHKIQLSFAYASGRPEIVEYLVERGLVGDIDRSMYHVSNGLDLGPKETILALKDMQRLLNEGKATASKVGYRITDPKSKVKFADLDYINKTYGNLYTWCVENNREDLVGRLVKEARMSQKEAEDFIKWK